MLRLVLSWLFSVFSVMGRSRCPVSEDEARSFCSFLSEDLEKLEQSLVESSISLQWSVEAMKLLKKMQVELLQLLKKPKLPISYGTEEDWFDQYMKETAMLLDFCNTLKSAVSRINRYRIVVDLAIQKFSDSDSVGVVAEIELERLETEREKIFDVGRRETIKLSDGIAFEGTNKHGKSSTTIVMIAVHSTMVVISMLLVSAIHSPVSIDMGSGKFTCRFPQLRPFMASLTSLINWRAENCSGLVLAELEMVDRVIGDLKAQVVEGEVEEDRGRFLSGVDQLRTEAFGLREGIEMFEAVVDEVFQEVIKGRNEMLEIFRDGALSMG